VSEGTLHNEDLEVMATILHHSEALILRLPLDGIAHRNWEWKGEDDERRSSLCRCRDRESLRLCSSSAV
jgi:hypothetical protein